MPSRNQLKKPIPSVIDIVVDLGRSLLKGMIHGRKKTVVVIPHALRMPGKEKFDDIQRRNVRGRSALVGNVDIDRFCFEGEYYVIGENAESSPIRRSGGDMYKKDYYTPLMIAMLMRLLPNGHENIRLTAAFPPGEIRHLDNLMACLGGKHTATRVDGSEVVYKVRQVLTYDEPVGGLRNFLLADDGKHYRTRQIDNRKALCWDIGGKISSLVPFRADGWVDYDKAKSVDLGIQDVMERVSYILLNTPEYADQFTGHRGSTLPFDEAMRSCLVSGYYFAGGKDLPALDAIADATENIRRGLRDVYIQSLGGPREYSYMIITGGGGGLLAQQLIEHVMIFPPERIYLSHENPAEMHLANMFGGDKQLAVILAKGQV